MCSSRRQWIYNISSIKFEQTTIYSRKISLNSVELLLTWLHRRTSTMFGSLFNLKLISKASVFYLSGTSIGFVQYDEDCWIMMYGVHCIKNGFLCQRAYTIDLAWHRDWYRLPWFCLGERLRDAQHCLHRFSH